MPRKPNCKCAECGIEIYRRPYDIEKSKSGKVFCSSICFNKQNRKPHSCPTCGKELLSGTNKTCCSRSCSNKARVGIKYKRDKATYVNDMPTYRTMLINERDASCELCGYKEHPQILVVHHILERKNGGTNDITNLQLICPNCHALQHYGKLGE